MTKKPAKSLLIIFIFLISLFLYQKFTLEKDKNDAEKIISQKKELNLDNKNNLIKNLRYDVNFENNTKYNITADTSELIYDDKDEIVKMQVVEAIFTDKGGLPLTITSDYAIFNNTTYNTTFSKNVKIRYIGNKMNSDKLFLNFEKNVVIINDNIIYEGVIGYGKADNIEINLITKDVKIFMNNLDDKIEITSKAK